MGTKSLIKSSILEIHVSSPEMRISLIMVAIDLILLVVMVIMVVIVVTEDIPEAMIDSLTTLRKKKTAQACSFTLNMSPPGGLR